MLLVQVKLIFKNKQVPTYSTYIRGWHEKNWRCSLNLKYRQRTWNFVIWTHILYLKISEIDELSEKSIYEFRIFMNNQIFYRVFSFYTCLALISAFFSRWTWTTHSKFGWNSPTTSLNRTGKITRIFSYINGDLIQPSTKNRKTKLKVSSQRTSILIASIRNWGSFKNIKVHYVGR